ncbi:DUF4123 domain-containing protein [Iodobacter sp. CM08]|uniref:DUF4123 domain-containing protein n=1 Tax=Iodobacter sp. CM08 TaxID=3085902 RepID=UPI0029818822|nr:DUF4123 domain-containing protein [Iodobacter sp. CM08]MDW5416709.1 DUF4123 domain-containing protein [Iodobacter sp. CM08]
MMIDLYPQQTAQVLMQWLEPNLNTETQLYALLDHSFDPKLLRKMKEQISYAALYQDQGGDVEVSPLLCMLDTQSELQAQIELLLQITAGQPMLSFWLSPLDREAIFSHFANYFDVTLLPENISMVLRYADTRILPNLLATFNPEQSALFLRPFVQMAYFDRAAKPVFVNGSQQQQIADSPLILTEQQFNQMMDHSLPDQVLQQIYRDKLQTLLPAQASQAYLKVSYECVAARAEGLAEFAEVASYCTARLQESGPLS